MKKLFLFIPVLFFALIANAKEINVASGATGAIRLAMADANTEDGDILVLEDGVYTENEVIDFYKSVTIEAATSAHPIVAQHYYNMVTSGADVKFIGIKFDGSLYNSGAGANDYCFYSGDNTEGKELHFENCEFVGFKNYVMFSGWGSSKFILDSLIINNCFFHNNVKSAVIYYEKCSEEGKQALKGLKVTNSTFANNATTADNSVIYIQNNPAAETADVEVTVQNCTFYNNTTKNYDHGIIRSYKSTKVTVSNCIFANPVPANLPATSCYGGTVSNCLTYNLNYYDSRYGHKQSSGLTDNIVGNPVFKDPANNDFTLLNASSARRLGKMYGDPRWHQAIETVAIPATLLPKDALLSDSASVISGTSDSIDFKYTSSRGRTSLEWAKWKVTVAKSGLYNFTAFAKRTGSSDEQKLEISVLNSNESEVLKSKLDESVANEGTISTGNVNLTAGNTYVVKVRNTYNWAVSKLTKVEATYAGGATVNIPGQILCEEAVICQVDGGHTPKMYHLENGDLKYNDNGYNLEEYAYWNIDATEAGEMAVTLNVANSGHIFSLELYQGETRLDSIGEIWEGDEKTLWEDGDITLPNTLTFPSAGSYRLKLLNNQAHSGGVLHGITFAPYVAPAGVTMTDTDTDNTAWVAHLNETSNVQLNRTILGGMYNTICLPFTVSSGKCKAIFGSDVELYTLGSATISGDILNLQFNTSSDIWKGTPILIKTSSNIVNPLFEGVTIERETADRTTREAVTFRGTFVSKDFHNGDQVLLLVANNMLSYPLSDRTLKGFRAYFEVNNPQASAPIRGARIIAGQNVVTSIDLVEAQTEGVTKVIENGQLIIIRDGVRLNALGVQVQ